MLLKRNDCKACTRFAKTKGYSTTVGRGSNGVLLVGAFPSETDLMQERALSKFSERGSMLNRALGIRSLDIEDFTYTNLTRCPGQPEWNEIHHCAQAYLKPLLDKLKPKCIVAMGEEVVQYFTGLSGAKTDLRHTRGFMVPGKNVGQGYDVKITFDPVFVRQGNMNFLGCLADDLKASITQRREKHNYRTVVGIEHVQEFIEQVRQNPEQPLAYDIETLYSIKKNDEEEFRRDLQPITQIQFALDASMALVLPWSAKASQATKTLLGLPNPKLSWNGNTFDQPRLEKEGILFAGDQIDLMLAWHFWQPDLPMNLSFAAGHFQGHRLPPWKHTMHEDMNNYGALDVISLHLLMSGIYGKLMEEKLYTGYQTFIQRFYPVLLDMSRRGILIDLDERKQLKDWIQVKSLELDAEIQALVHDDLKDCHPKNGYKRSPRGMFQAEDGNNYILVKGESKKLIQRQFGEDLRWCYLKPFLVKSPKQVKRYIDAQGHKLPKTKKGRKWKESGDKAALTKLSGKVGSGFYTKLIELREFGKIEGTYIDGWAVDEEGKVHPEYHTAPASGQIGSRDPNAQNVPKPGKPGTLQFELANRIRKTIAASPNHKLVELDMSAFHAKTLAFCAQDSVYFRMAGLDPHSFLAAHLLGLEGVDNWLQLDDADLADRLKWVKKNHEWVRNKQAKPSILGIGFGMGVGKLYRMNEDSFKDEKEAKRVHDILKSLFPGIFRWQNEIRTEAHVNGKLITPFGCVRRFYDVYTFDHITGDWHPGSQSEECIAFPPSNIAHCHMKDAMLRMQEKGYDEKYGLCNMIHDSVIFNCADRYVEECLENIKAEMEAKSTVLVDPVICPDGFWVATDAMVGSNWAEMEKI